MIGRAFVAIVPATEVLDAVDLRLAAMRERVPGLRWSGREQRHITLRFLGRVPDVDALAVALEGVARGTPPFRVRLGGAGAFPKRERASTLWLDIDEGEVELSGLAAAVRRVTEDLGVPVEGRPFRPHLTTARANPPRSVGGVVDELADEPIGPPWTVERFALFASDTRPEGAVHTVVRSFALGGDAA